MRDSRIEYAETFDGARWRIVGVINKQAPIEYVELSSMANGDPVRFELEGVEYYSHPMSSKPDIRMDTRFGGKSFYKRRPL